MNDSLPDVPVAKEEPVERWFAIIDEGAGAKIPGQLLDYEKRVCLAAEHVRSPGKFPVPVGCDLALKRYWLFKKPNGRETFVPIHHAKDAGAENLNPAEPIEVTIAKAFLELAAGGDLGADTHAAISAFLNSNDAR